MKRILSLLLLVSVLSIAFADIDPARRMQRPMVNQAQESVYQPWVAPWALVMPRWFAPSWLRAQPSYSAPQQIVPVPPVCGLACLRVPIEGIAR
jgi:hypothetical protein